MIQFVLGTQNSGKSELAESLASETGDALRYYLATMKVYDAEGKARIERHRKMREGKGFLTIEKEYGIGDAADLMQTPKQATVLLECVSNLVGNELFENPAREDLLQETAQGMQDRAQHTEKTAGEASAETTGDEVGDALADAATEIAGQIAALGKRVHHLILVSNTYPSDGPDYDAKTRLYIKLLNLVNEKLTKMADRVYDLRKG